MGVFLYVFLIVNLMIIDERRYSFSRFLAEQDNCFSASVYLRVAIIDEFFIYINVLSTIINIYFLHVLSAEPTVFPF